MERERRLLRAPRTGSEDFFENNQNTDTDHRDSEAMSIQLGLPLAVREKELADLKPIQPFRTRDERFQGKLTTSNVCRVRVELPKYRLENGRTSAAQRDYIAKQRLDANFFDPSRSEND